MSEGDNIGYGPSQQINPFSDGHKRRWNTAADAAEALYNPQINGDGGLDLVPGEALNLEINPSDPMEGTGSHWEGPRILAEITGETNPAEYTARQVVQGNAGGTYTTVANGYVWNSAGADQEDLICRQGIAGLPIGMVFEAILEIDDSGYVRWIFDATGVMIPVDVTVSSGSNGTFDTTAPDWKYDVDDKHGQRLINNTAPENNRDECTYTSATKGYAYLGDNGVWVLGWVNEEIDLPSLASIDHYGFYVASASTGGDTIADTDTVGGQNIDTNPAPPATGELKFRQPVRQSCSQGWIGVKTDVRDDGGGDTFITQWINFNEYKAECPPALNDVLTWDGNSWEPGGIAAAGGCTATYNKVTGTNAVSATADDCSWEILFIEGAHSGMTAGIEASVAEDGVNDKAEVTLQLNFADIDASDYDAGKTQVLGHINGTLAWIDTAECP